MNGLLTGGGRWVDVAVPDAAFAWLPFTVQRRGRKFRAKGFDLRTHAAIPVTKTYWVKPASEGGSDAANGLSEATAFASINRGLSRADVDRVMVKGASGAGAIYGVTVYPSSRSWNNQSPARNVEVIGYGGKVISTSHVEADNLVWTPVDSHYEASYGTAFSQVRDGGVPTTYGDASKLTQVASVAAVDATPGSWYYTGGVLSVHTADSRAPDANLYCFIGVAQGRIDDGVKYYVEGIEFWGGSNAWLGSTTSPDAKVYLKNCTFRYSTNDCISIAGCGEIILQGCTVARGDADGVHMAVSTAQAANLVMIDCTLRNHGLTGATNSNAYSRHGPGSTVVIGGQMYECYGPTINDITDGTTLWCLGVYARDPVSASGRFNFGGQNTTLIWLDSCRSSGGVDGDVRAYDAATVIRHRKMSPSIPVAATGSGTVTTY